jgi:predicted secreted Zn-dependent protease
MKRTLSAAFLLAFVTLPASAASVVKTYSYFSVGGSSMEEIETELSKRGPHIRETGLRHPGATRMAFTTRFVYAEGNGQCRVAKANVTVKAKVILPRWRRNRKAEEATFLIWDTLEADIKRHEESHVVIAKNYAAELERALRAIGPQEDCSIVAAKAKLVSSKILKQHDLAQNAFDNVERVNFESRIIRLLQYRMERINNGTLPEYSRGQAKKK